MPDKTGGPARFDEIVIDPAISASIKGSISHTSDRQSGRRGDSSLGGTLVLMTDEFYRKRASNFSKCPPHDLSFNLSREHSAGVKYFVKSDWCTPCKIFGILKYATLHSTEIYYGYN